MMPTMNTQELEQKAKWIRSQCIQMSFNAKEGHLGSALSCVDILVGLYDHFNFEPSDPERDRLYFSKGHAVSALYNTMITFEILSPDIRDTYAQQGTRLTPHPDKNLLPELEMSSGSLGHGLGVACGAALALKLRGSSAKCIVVMGDGECNEGSVWEAAQFATSHNLDNLIVIVDYNGIQSIGRTDEISGHTSLYKKFWAFGWDVTTGPGNSIEWLQGIITNHIEHNLQTKPFFIEACTTYGKGVSFMMDQLDGCLWHYRVPSEDEVKRALKELKLDA